MTWCIAKMSAQISYFWAILFAFTAFVFARSSVTFHQTFVLTTEQRFPTRHTTTEIFLTTWNGHTLFVFAVAVSGSECHTWWTITRMTIVLNWMITGLFPRAGSITGWSFRSARNWWINNIRTTFTIQFVERRPIAWRTFASVAWLIALMFTARQAIIAYCWTDMIDVYTAFGIAFMFSATSLQCRKKEKKLIQTTHTPTTSRHLLTTTLQRFLQRASSARVCN